MKYLKTFEGFEGFRKFFHVPEDRDKSRLDFFNELDRIEREVSENPEIYVFNRERLEKQAEDHDYKGKLRVQRASRDKSRMYVVYDEGLVDFGM